MPDAAPDASSAAPDATASDATAASPPLEAEHLTLAYGSFVIMRDLTFQIEKGEIFIIMGGSGSGKSTLMKHLMGLLEPSDGIVRFEGNDLSDPDVQEAMRQRMGVLYQRNALWSSMTLAENLALPLNEYTDLTESDIRRVVSLKLALVGLRGFESFYPHEISGGMQKRAALARAIALDPDVLFFDEPSAGLDPLSSKRLDDLILRLRDSLCCTVVVVTHELQSIFDVADRCLFLDAETRRQGPIGPPEELRDTDTYPAVREFLRRGVNGD